MLRILYVNAMGAGLGLVGLLIERVLPPAARRRWIWAAIIPLSLAVPGFYRARHTWSITSAFEQHAAHPSEHALALVPRWVLALPGAQRKYVPAPLRHAQRFIVPAVALALLLVVLSMPHPVLGRAPQVQLTQHD